MTLIEQVRLRIGDADSDVFDDAEVQQFLDDAEDDIFLAAADALEAIAASAALVAKLQRTGNLTIDRRAIPGELRKLAAVYRARVAESPATAWAEQSVSPFAIADIAAHRAMRG